MSPSWARVVWSCIRLRFARQSPPLNPATSGAGRQQCLPRTRALTPRPFLVLLPTKMKNHAWIIMNPSGRTRPKQRFPPSLRPDGRLCHLSKQDDPGRNNFRANVGKGVNAGDFERVCRGQPDGSLQLPMVKWAVGAVLFAQQHLQLSHRNPAGRGLTRPGRGTEGHHRSQGEGRQWNSEPRSARHHGCSLIRQAFATGNNGICPNRLYK